MRRKLDRPTYIYWLFDTRTGEPFYCGKTIGTVEERLRKHKFNSVKFPRRLVSQAIARCEGHLRIQTMEIVPAGDDWCERERRWIHILRATYPNRAANVSDGGEGAPGWVPSSEFREKLRVIARSKSAEISRALKDRWSCPLYRASMIAKSTGRSQSPESRTKISEARRGKRQSSEVVERISRAMKGRKQSPEFIEKRASANRGKKRSAEFIARMSSERKGKSLSAEHRAKISASLRGRKMPPGTGAKRWITRRAKQQMYASHV